MQLAFIVRDLNSPSGLLRLRVGPADGFRTRKVKRISPDY